MKKIILLVIILASIGYYFWSYFSSSHGDQIVSYNPSSKECFSENKGEWKYCVHLAKQGTNGGIAYLLHGRNLDEQSWNDDTFYTAMLQKYWAESNVKPPTVVTISFGSFWLLAPKGKAKKSGLLDTFLNTVIPTVERKTGKPTYRALFGESMGGLNSLIAGLSSAGLFKKVGSLCPAIYKNVTPFSSLSEMNAAMIRTGAEPKMIYGVISLAKEFASTEDEWNQIAPIKLLDQLSSSAGIELYVSSDLYDKYGNFEGTEEFAKLARQKGLKVQWRPLYGGHCAIDIVSLGDFLL